MTTGPDGERRQEPTFADVMNGFGLDSGRPVRRRLFGRRRGAPAEPEFRTPVRPATATPAPGAPLDPYDAGPPDGPDVSDAPSASAVRAFPWTRGGTKSGLALWIETLVSTSARGRAQAA